MQGLYAQIAPIAVEPQRAMGGPGARGLEQPAGHVQAGARGRHLGGRHRQGHLAAAVGVECLAGTPGLVEQAGRLPGQQSRTLQPDVELAIVGQGVGIFARARRAGREGRG